MRMRWTGWAMALLMASPALAADAPARLTLADAVRIASSEAPAVTLADLRVREASARVGQVRAALLPSLTGSASMNDHTTATSTTGIELPPGALPDKLGPVRVLDARVRANQAVLDLASWQRVRAAGLGVQASRAEQATSAETAAQAAAAAWVRAARATAAVHAREADLAIAEELAALADAQRDAGTSPGIDATRARTQVAASRGALLVARNQQQRAGVDLARALGLDPATPLTLADTLSFDSGVSEAPEAVDAAIALALERRNELRGEQARLARAQAEKAAISAERIPRLDATAAAGPSGTTFDNALVTRDFGLALTWPIVDGARRESRLAEQRSLVRESEVREKDLRQQIEAEVRSAQIDLASGFEQRAVARERLQLAEEELSQARERFVNGVAGNIEVINAQSSLVRARDADIDARFAVASARIALARAAGVARTLR